MPNLPSWAEFLSQEAQKPYYKSLWEAANAAYESKTCYPPQAQIYQALTLCPLHETKVVILGQDPYHGAGQANGLAFSVQNDQKTPPSLRNIFKELYDDLGITRLHNDLSDWAQQGVLLLNAVLSVEEKKANSHKHFGWQTLTDAMISHLSEQEKPIVFVLWGAQAQQKSSLINPQKHMILESVHPSPLSAYRGFLGSKVFSKINAILEGNQQKPIAWEDQAIGF
jgi:uracil-DNA glycosylase